MQNARVIRLKANYVPVYQMSLTFGPIKCMNQLLFLDSEEKMLMQKIQTIVIQ